MNPFDIVKAARALLAATESTTCDLSIQTVADYETISWRLITKAAEQVDEIIQKAANTTRPTTWYKRRAALTYHCRSVIQSLLPEQDVLQRQLRSQPDNTKVREQWDEMIKELDFCVRLYNAVQEAEPICKANCTPRHSKKQDLYGLPPDWRERLLERMGPKYYMPYLVTACTGCRPSELLTSVELRIENGELIATIQGKKVKEESAGRASQGQPFRTLTWKLPASGLVQLLSEYVAEEGGTKTVSLPDGNGLKNFTTAIRDAGRRQWPARKKSITAYCLRHMFSADLKASGMSRQDIAAAMGQAADTTAKHYGSAQQAGKTSVAPDRVEASREVRKKYVHQPPERQKPVIPSSDD